MQQEVKEMLNLIRSGVSPLKIKVKYLREQMQGLAEVSDAQALISDAGLKQGSFYH